MTHTTTAYPALPRLKALYPIIGVKVLSEDDGGVRAVQTINGKAVSFVIFTGADRTEVEGNILRLFHWEKTHKRLPLPFSIEGAVKKSTAPVSPPVVSPKVERTPNSAGRAVNNGALWAHHPAHGTRRHRDTTREALEAAGWTLGRPKR